MVERRTILKAIAGGAGLASVQGLFPAWAQTGSRGIAPTITTLNGPEIALNVGHAPFSVGGRTGQKRQDQGKPQSLRTHGESWMKDGGFYSGRRPHPNRQETMS